MATTTHRDPAATVRRAWSTLRLPELQAIVQRAILELEQLPPEAVLGRELSALERQSEDNPITAALEAFCEELRDESGMADSRARRIEQSAHIRENIHDQPEAWTTTFHEALDKYREAAARVLSVSLADVSS